MFNIELKRGRMKEREEYPEKKSQQTTTSKTRLERGTNFFLTLFSGNSKAAHKCLRFGILLDMGGRGYTTFCLAVALTYTDKHLLQLCVTRVIVYTQ